MGMTIDEAIMQFEHLSEHYQKLYDKYFDYGGKDQWKIDAEEYRQRAEWLKDYKNLLLAMGAIKSLHQSRRILLMKGDEVLHLVEDIIDRHTSGKEDA